MLSIGNYIDVILFVFGCIGSVIGFYIRELYNKMTKLEDDLNKHKIDDAQVYITHIEMKDLKDDIRGMFSAVNTKLSSIEIYLRKDKTL